MKKTLALSVTALALIAAGCGGDDSDEATEEEAGVTPKEAIAEIAEVRQGLDRSLTAYIEGDAAEAEQLAGDAYLEHFELVEGPLEERDEELNEELEQLIREDVRDAIVNGARQEEVIDLIDQANNGLDQAERELKRG